MRRRPSHFLPPAAGGTGDIHLRFARLRSICLCLLRIDEATGDRPVVPAVLRWASRALFAVIVAAVVAVIAVLLVIPRATNGAALTVAAAASEPFSSTSTFAW